VKSLSTENVVVKKSPFLIIISTFRGVGSGEKFPDPDPAKRSGSDRIRIPNTDTNIMVGKNCRQMKKVG
jgi:hypothetical protein